ncbi:GFA family protein [Devosia rhizoryzae]|uniref:GFA family protein n=1 Tax=Devosia rhizoryzae TaxID=2774137 RepID=A0ABX7CC20_9HYPH|nr:GFA family protein [Devosia rhizoryzae]QQR40302.1 GFA family protein [Devosia rhizoryzae]
MPRPELDLTADCDCGAVTLRVTGKAVSMFQCGCENCQKVSGSGHSSVVLMPAGSVELSGLTKSFERPADSGATFTRHFCPDCGTTILAHSSRAPDLRIVPAGLLAGQNDWFSPNQLIFARSHPDWDNIAEQIPRYDTYRPEKS